MSSVYEGSLGLVEPYLECPRPIKHLPPRRAAQNFRNLILPHVRKWLSKKLQVVHRQLPQIRRPAARQVRYALFSQTMA